MSEQMRKAFEAWMNQPEDTLKPEIEIDSFDLDSIERALKWCAWEAWQAALATQPQAPQGAVPESAILRRAKCHLFEADDMHPADYEIFDSEAVSCKDCIDVLIVRADSVKVAAPETPEGRK